MMSNQTEIEPATEPRPGRATELEPARAIKAIQAIQTRFANLDGLGWGRLESLRGHHTIACVDGRHDGCVTGAPGGNAGALVLVLAALEAEVQQTLAFHDVVRLLQRYVARFGRFYMHTATLALSRLVIALQWPTDHGFDTVCAGPRTPEQRAPWLKALVEPDHVGCGHLSLMLRHPERYGVRRGLVEDLRSEE